MPVHILMWGFLTLLHQATAGPHLPPHICGGKWGPAVPETKTVRTTCKGNWAWPFYKRLAFLLADKRKQDYGKTISWLQCFISFSLVRSAVMCLRGACSSFHQPAKQVNCEVPLDVAISEGRVPSQWTLNFFLFHWYIRSLPSCFCFFLYYSSITTRLSIITGLDYRNGLLEWTTGMDYWTDLFLH